jgi:hypothetical protein
VSQRLKFKFYPNVFLHPNTFHLPSISSVNIFHPASFSNPNMNKCDLNFTAFEALLVPFHATGYALLGGVHGL